MKKCFNCPNRPCGSGVVANNRLVDYRLIDFFGHSSAPFSPIGLIFSPINSLGMIYPKTKFLFVVDLRAAFMFRKLTIFNVQKKNFGKGWAGTRCPSEMKISIKPTACTIVRKNMIEGAKEAYSRDLKSSYGHMMSENVTDNWHPKNTFLDRAGLAGKKM